MLMCTYIHIVVIDVGWKEFKPGKEASLRGKQNDKE